MINTHANLNVISTGPDIKKFETELYWSLWQKRVNQINIPKINNGYDNFQPQSVTLAANNHHSENQNTIFGYSCIFSFNPLLPK